MTDTIERTEAVDTYKEAAPLLRRPFTPEAVRFKVQAAFGSPETTSALIVAYIDARLVVERLNLVCPHLWHDEYVPATDGMLCNLTIDNITRRDLGSGYKGKGLYSDALKRAAVKFGVGVSLYAIPQMFLKVSDGHLKVKGKTVTLSPNGETRCRSLYTTWLAQKGVQTFGQPLDHGDTAESVGDVESMPPEESDADPGTIGNAIAKKMVDRIWKVVGAKDKVQLAASHAAKRDVGECDTKPKAVAAISTLTFDQGQVLDRWIGQKEAGENE